MVANDSIVHQVDLPMLIEVGVRVFVHPFPASCPTSVGDAAGRNPSLRHDLVDNFGNASSLFCAMFSVFDQPTSVNSVGSVSIDSCAVITSVFEELNALAEEFLKAVAMVFGVHLGLLLFGDGALHNHADYSAAFHLLLLRERGEAEESSSGEKFFYHPNN